MNPKDFNPESRLQDPHGHDPQENLSSFMDGEVDKSAGSFLVRRLASDESLRATWDRYHMIRDCLRQQDAQLVHADLCSRVRQAIDLEDMQQPAPARHLAWIKPLAGAAIAASVALVAVWTVNPGQPSGPGAMPGAEPMAPAVAAQAEPFVSPNIGGIVPASQPVNLSGDEARQDEKAKAYLLRHYQLTGEGGGQGFVALVPIVVTSNVVATDEEAEALTANRESE
jgi:sigma-E factor negative regulatory protein RseA